MPPGEFVYMWLVVPHACGRATRLQRVLHRHCGSYLVSDRSERLNLLKRKEKSSSIPSIGTCVRETVFVVALTLAQFDRSAMIFHISLVFTAVLSHSVSAIQGELCDDSMAQAKHWKLVIASSKKVHAIELTTRDRKTILIAISGIDRFVYSDMSLYQKFPVARYDGQEDDFDCVLRHHPMRGGKYSETFNNCQHFAAHFLILLKALADGDRNKSFEGTDIWTKIIDNVISKDDTYLWNSPNLYFRMVRLGYPLALMPVVFAADVAAGATATVMVPASGIMGWLGVETATVVAAPYAAAAAFAASTMSAGMIAGAGIGTFVYRRKRSAWKEQTKVNNPLVFGFPTGEKPRLSASELFP